MSQDWSLDWPHYQSYFIPRLKSGAKVLGDAKRSTLAVTRESQVLESTRGTEVSTEPTLGVAEDELWGVIESALGSDRSLLHQSAEWQEQLGLKRHPHFLLSACLGKWNQLFPSEYALVIRLTGVRPGAERSEAIWIRVKQGQLIAIERLAQISEDAKLFQEQVQALAEKEKISVQGLLMRESDWLALGAQGQSWKKFAALLKRDQAQLAPFRWRVALWVGMRGLTAS